MSEVSPVQGHESPHFCRDRGRGGAERHRAVRRARAFLHAHACDAVRLEALARAVGLSKFHLMHAFRAQLGVSLHQYQLALRIEHAKVLLAGGARVGDVAVAVGFADQSHLTRLFKRRVGLTPGAYQLAMT